MDIQKVPTSVHKTRTFKKPCGKINIQRKFHTNTTQGRRVPLHLLERVEQELEKLIEYKQIIRLEKCSEEYFISPVVITVKRTKALKLHSTLRN